MLLTAGDDEIRIDPAQGGRVAGLTIAGLEILVGSDPDPFKWGCYPMAPWAGRVRNGRFTWQNAEVRLPIRMPPHAIHGTVFDQPWRQSEASQLEIQLGDSWPWPGTATSQFAMEPGRFRWELSIDAEEEPMPVVLGWHPWFRKHLADGSHATLEFSAEQMYVRDAEGIPSGRRSAPSPGPWDDCFTRAFAAPRIRWSNGLILEISSSTDHWVIYSQPEHALCIEPQSGPPDGFNQGNHAIARPGAPLSHAMTWRWWQE